MGGKKPASGGDMWFGLFGVQNVVILDYCVLFLALEWLLWGIYSDINLLIFLLSPVWERALRGSEWLPGIYRGWVVVIVHWGEGLSRFIAYKRIYGLSPGSPGPFWGISQIPPPATFGFLHTNLLQPSTCIMDCNDSYWSWPRNTTTKPTTGLKNEVN